MNYSTYDCQRIKKVLSSPKDYWCPIINGQIEDYLRFYMSSKGFYNIKMPLVNDRYTSKRWTIPLNINEEKLELSSSNAMHLGAVSSIYDKVYSLQTVLRKEKNYDENHFLEFNVLEAEWQEDDYNNLLSFIENMLIDTISKFNDFLAQNKLHEYFNPINVEFPLRKINYNDLDDYTPKDECGFYDSGIDNKAEEPFFVMFYPPESSWRAKVISKDKAFIFNLVLPHQYGELVECSLRETSSKIMNYKFQNANIKTEMEWYLEALSYNSKTRCGFGLGVGRLCRWLTGSKSLESTEVFPRKL